MRKMTEQDIKEMEALMAWEGNMVMKKGNSKKTQEDSKKLQENSTFTIIKGNNKTLFTNR